MGGFLSVGGREGCLDVKMLEDANAVSLHLRSNMC